MRERLLHMRNAFEHQYRMTACHSAIIAPYFDMVTMFRGSNWKIAVYGRDHGVPHFHIEGADFRCSISIASFEQIVGSAPAPVMRDALAWARQNQVALLQTWQELNG